MEAIQNKNQRYAIEDKLRVNEQSLQQFGFICYARKFLIFCIVFYDTSD